MKKIFYWGPFIDNRIATVKAIYNSVTGINKYSKNYNAFIINSLGEWNYKIEKINKNFFLNSKLNLIDKFPKNGFLKSRISYILIFILCFRPLKKIILKYTPDFFIAHLIISLPMILFTLFSFNTKLIIRISGKPKLNLLRKFIWKNTSKNVYRVFCPTDETKKILIEKKIFDKKKIFVLDDPIFSIKEVLQLKKEKIEDQKFENNNIILIGRLTRQKNFDLIIDAYLKNKNLSKSYKIFILGSGELESELKKKIKKYNLDKKIFLLGYKNNIYNYLSASKLFILTSLWEDPGFVLVEAAINNVSILSSNCPSGPEEILGKNEFGGYLFENNNINSLNKKIDLFINDKHHNIFSKKKYIKQKIRKYSIFRHATNLEKYLSSNKVELFE